MVALLVVSVLGYRRIESPRWVVFLPIAMILSAILLHLWQADLYATLGAGLFVGAMASLLYRLGSKLFARRTADGTVPVRSGMTNLPSFRLPLRATPLLLATFLLPQDSAMARRDGEEPILVLMPYEGIFHPGQLPDRVILRESDHKRLQTLAQPRRPTDNDSLFLTRAVHHLAWSGDHQVSLVSDLDLRSTAVAASSWRVPITGAHDIAASLDGSDVPVFIETGGQQAAITIPGAGSFKLQVRRTAAVTQERGEESLDFPVNSMPSARLIMDRLTRSKPPRVLKARGKVTAGGGSSLAADLGPVDHVEIRWGVADDVGPLVAGSSIESVMLWDIEPAGDRIRGRFTYRGSRQLSTLSFEMDPELMTRTAEIPGLIDSSWGGTAERPIWTARMDPPLQEGSVLILDLWRPARPLKAGNASIPTGDRPAGESLRQFPRLEPLGVERYSGLLGLRRPGNWTGRLALPSGADSLSDESFVKSWGPLPDDRLTLSGTTRLVRDGLPSLLTGPAVTRIKVKPLVELGISAGRIDVQFDADLDDAAGSLDHLELAVPHDLVVLSVESDGLTDWSRPDSRQLLLRYDRPFPRTHRRLRIAGWIPVPEDPLRIGSQQLEMPTPWVAVSDMEAVAATLIIEAPSRFQVKGAPGLSLLPSEPPPAANVNDERVRQSYRTTDPEKLGSLQWSTTPPRVNVLIESQMTVSANSAEWIAVLRYDVFGGALDSIHLKLPTSWTKNAQVELTGGDFRRTVGPTRPVCILDSQTQPAIMGVSASGAALGTAALTLPGTSVSRDRPLGARVRRYLP